MTKDPAALAAEALPCVCSHSYCRDCDGNTHHEGNANCPAYYRLPVAAALLAAEQRGAERERADIAQIVDYAKEHLPAQLALNNIVPAIRARGNQ